MAQSCKTCEYLNDTKLPSCPATGKSYIPPDELYTANTCLFYRPKLVLTYKLDDQEELVMNGLRNHRGAGRAVKAPELAAEVGLSDPDGRRTRYIIANLMRKYQAHGEVICSDPVRGFWLAETEEEIRAARGVLASRYAEIAARLEYLDAAAKMWRAKRGA